MPPAPPVLISSFEPASQYAFELVQPGWHGDWHPAPGRVLAIYLSGDGEIEASDGENRAIRPGTILLVEDTTGKGHVSRVTGSEEMLAAPSLRCLSDGRSPGSQPPVRWASEWEL